MGAHRPAIASLLSLFLATSSARAIVLDGNSPIDSRNRIFQATPGPDARSTRVFRKTGSRIPQQIWEKADWNPVAFLSDDGDYLVAGYDGNNLLAQGHAKSEVMLVFFHRDKVIKTVRLNEIILDQRHLRFTDSGVLWGYYEGFLSAHEFAVDTVEQRRLVYDVTSGALIRAIPSPSSLVKDQSKEPAASRHREVR